MSALFEKKVGEKDYAALRELFKHHIESFDYMVEAGLDKMLTSIEPVVVFDSHTQTNLRNKLRFGRPEVFPPQKQRASGTTMDTLYPFECRQAKLSYTGKFLLEVCLQYGDGAVIREKLNFGQFPIMLKSKLCTLRKTDSEGKPDSRGARKEDPSEMGGYFIMNGLERVIRLIILPKRNYPQSTIRSSFRERREGYSDKAVIIRCVREDQSAVTVKLYYLNNGSARLGFWIQGREYLLPVGIMLKALTETTDHEIYASLTSFYDEKFDRAKGCVGTQLIGERTKIILDEVQSLSLFKRSQCLRHIGEYFRPVMAEHENDSFSAVADAVLRDYIFVHLDNNQDKFTLLIFMLQKLFSLVDGTSMPDNPDSMQNQEVLLPGHLITIYMKEKLQEWLLRVKRMIMEELDNPNKKFDIGSLVDVKKIIDRNAPKSISSSIENMLKTGRLATQSGLDLQQIFFNFLRSWCEDTVQKPVKQTLYVHHMLVAFYKKAGMTVMAERLNFLRFISHFRAVHRGASFAGLRTTSVRKLLPESWGFMCPVHTPDGEPCGLLNHMTHSCRITSYYDSKGKIRDFFKIKRSILSILVGAGMTPSLPKHLHGGPPEVLSVLLDGCVVGSIPAVWVEKAIIHLRKLKLSAKSPIPYDLELGYIPLSICGAYPGLYIFSSPARFIRPVKNISVPPQDHNDIEFIGPLEQVYMEISCPDGGGGGRRNLYPATHEEIHPTGILSVVANLTPWSDHNQSPRNMYQCQMGKQTMGFSSQSINCRADQKLYHLQTPQTPIVRTKAYENYCIDDAPLGTNAIVAVLAYSGYDMEDAMVLNKSSVDRGMCHGYVYQTETIDLTEQSINSNRAQRIFRRSNVDTQVHHLIDTDGFPFVGQRINPDEPYCSVYNEIEGTTRLTKLKGSEPATVDYVSVDMKSRKKANIRLRRTRNPIIGDKFSSRHGQKGVCSQLWTDVDMPFSAVTGMRPDLIINPHAFPSRMTIGMLLESIAAKGGSLRGEFVDATPFPDSVKKNDEDQNSKSSSLVDELGAKLAAAGFNYHGVEVLYSGVYGTELTCEIFVGPVYYQRLRHMVSDKFQVRSTGIVDQITRQPIKGRKRGGGIRFGEMERDSLLAHGAAYLLHDRLHTSSDHHIADVCSLCGSVLTTSVVQPPKRPVHELSGLPPPKVPKKVTCVSCKTSKGMETVAMPYVFKLLAAELGGMNIKMNLQLSNGAGAGA